MDGSGRELKERRLILSLNSSHVVLTVNVSCMKPDAEPKLPPSSIVLFSSVMAGMPSSAAVMEAVTPAAP